MKQTLSIITVSCLLIISCAQNSSTFEKEYIKNLEEKNKALEKKLQEAKGKTETKNISQSAKSEEKNSKEYFTIGSTEDEVLEVMGDPTSVYNIGRDMKNFMYGLSSVTFQDGKVESYSNISGNLKVKFKK